MPYFWMHKGNREKWSFECHTPFQGIIECKETKKTETILLTSRIFWFFSRRIHRTMRMVSCSLGAARALSPMFNSSLILG